MKPPTLENARGLLTSLFFNGRRYDLGRVGRYKLSRRLELDAEEKTRVLRVRIEEMLGTSIQSAKPTQTI